MGGSETFVVGLLQTPHPYAAPPAHQHACEVGSDTCSPDYGRPRALLGDPESDPYYKPNQPAENH